ncbi:protein lethal(2)denticleless-like isoform X1 [Sitophilus oryzae]|uniref:Protein lethal(2)denticleless-like isoform X1 n=1 Tax=Sitophilus oryzae TaxID=7048 RepID=A0A6J2Y643_SITOR|nr:protein lethal(2)denticleless-like isoform X1 [Sitophilus oryzae]
MNNTQSLFNQQYGFSQWKQADSVMHHLHCEYEVSDFPLVDSSMFACKSAVKDGNEHFVGMANEDGTLAVIDCETKEKHSTLAHNNAIFDLSWMFDQMQIVTASGDHTSKLFDFGDGDFRQVRLFCGHSRSVKTVTFRKEDSSVFATGSRDGNIILWDTRTEQHSFIGVPDRIILNSHAGKDTHTPSKSRKKLQSCVNSGIKSVTGLVFQDYNTLISCGAGDGMIKVWDLRKTYSTLKKEPLPKFTIPYTGRTAKNGFSNLVIDSSGTKLYANCLDNTIYCYNVATYNVMPVAKYTGHQNSSFYIRSSLSKNDKYLISGSSDENAYIWNLKYSEPIVKLVGHSAEVSTIIPK